MRLDSETARVALRFLKEGYLRPWSAAMGWVLFLYEAAASYSENLDPLSWNWWLIVLFVCLIVGPFVSYRRSDARIRELESRCAELQARYELSLREAHDDVVFGDQSSLSPKDRIEEARSRIDDLLGRIEAGEIQHCAELSGVANKYLVQLKQYSPRLYGRESQRLTRALRECAEIDHSRE